MPTTTRGLFLERLMEQFPDVNEIQSDNEGSSNDDDDDNVGAPVPSLEDLDLDHVIRADFGCYGVGVKMRLSGAGFTMEITMVGNITLFTSEGNEIPFNNAAANTALATWLPNTQSVLLGYEGSDALRYVKTPAEQLLLEDFLALVGPAVAPLGISRDTGNVTHNGVEWRFLYNFVEYRKTGWDENVDGVPFLLYTEANARRVATMLA